MCSPSSVCLLTQVRDTWLRPQEDSGLRGILPGRVRGKWSYCPMQANCYCCCCCHKWVGRNRSCLDHVNVFCIVLRKTVLSCQPTKLTGYRCTTPILKQVDYHVVASISNWGYSPFHFPRNCICLRRTTLPSDSLVCLFSLHVLRVQDAKNFGWEINGDINYNWKQLLENKVRAINLWLSAFIVVIIRHKYGRL